MTRGVACPPWLLHGLRDFVGPPPPSWIFLSPTTKEVNRKIPLCWSVPLRLQFQSHFPLLNAQGMGQFPMKMDFVTTQPSVLCPCVLLVCMLRSFSQSDRFPAGLWKRDASLRKRGGRSLPILESSLRVEGRSESMDGE